MARMSSLATHRFIQTFVIRATFPVVVPLLLSGCATSPTGRMRDAHLLYTRDPDARQVTAVETFGPFYERVETASGAVRTSYRPFLHTRISAAGGEAVRTETGWPIYGANRRGDALSWRFLLCFGANADVTDPDSARRVWAFPFWFHGRTPAGEDYAALFPLYGTIRNMFWDRIRFVGFPLWVEYDRAGLSTKSVLWPIFSRTTGERGGGFNVFPFYGQMAWYEKSEASYVMWPIWNSADYQARNPGRAWMLFPVAGRVDRASESKWMVLPPFFSVMHGRGPLDGYRKILSPWPLVRIEDRGDRHVRNFFPFWGRRYRSDGTYDSRWVLWPFYRFRHAERANRRERSHSVFPVYHHSRVVSRASRGGAFEHAEEDFLRVWPFYSRRQEPGHAWVRVPDLSVSKRAGAIDRNVLGMFTLYTRGETTAPAQVDRSALWGLFRRDRGEQRRATRVWPVYDSEEADAGWRWSALGGLLGREGRDGVSAWRFLWFFGGLNAADADGKEAAE